MRQNLTQRHGATGAPRTLRAEWLLAGGLLRGRLAGPLASRARSIADDLGAGGLRIALVLAACITVLGMMGIGYAASGSLSAFDLNAEQHFDIGLVAGMNVPTLFSGAVLFVAAGYGFAAASFERLPWGLLGAFFAFMAIDEVMKVHETSQHLAGIDWQLLYLPIAAAGGICWLIAVRRTGQLPTARLLLLGGAVAWIGAQLLELVANASGQTAIALYGEMAVMEEVLEMTGSSMFVLALYLVWRRLAAERARLSRHHSRA